MLKVEGKFIWNKVRFIGDGAATAMVLSLFKKGVTQLRFKVNEIIKKNYRSICRTQAKKILASFNDWNWTSCFATAFWD
ncbi:hypothetical protein P8452_69388 [Trifolium repens]|nr:hypothetical protein P8452_24249 [Trifolium repens]WJX77897.1 hypothetical protein P8452_61165 [Trifolium repens]WJX87169.1 hypothetical protein P8452_69388 [Trifolium repens]